jgi:hypothetical protein
MNRLLLAVLLSLSFASDAHAHALTDLWWNPGESGWGLNVVHENNRLVVTLYVHDAAKKPRWYGGALLRYGNTAAGDPEFLGDLFETDGTPFSTPWNPADVQRRWVGQVKFRARPGGTAAFEYAIDGVTVLKPVQRFTIDDDRFEGAHFATLMRRYGDCAGSVDRVEVEHGLLAIDRQSGVPGTSQRLIVDMALVDGTRAICSFGGRFERYGRSGGMQGNYACSDGSAGPVEFKNIEFDSFGFSARFTAVHPTCGEFGGVLSGVRTSAR